MKPIRITYDPEGDILYLTFGQPTSATGYQLSDQLLLRLDAQTQKVAGLTIFNYSVHAHSGEEIPLPGLEDDPDLKPLLLSALTSSPLAQFLRTSESKDGFRAVLLSPSLPEAIAV